MSVKDEPLPCDDTYDCEGCPHYDGDACIILMDRIWLTEEREQ